MNKTWFIDIDGTLVKHLENKEIDEGMHEELLPYAVEFLEGLEERGDCIILTTARLEEHRQVTEKMLEELVVEAIESNANTILPIPTRIFLEMEDIFIIDYETK